MYTLAAPVSLPMVLVADGLVSIPVDTPGPDTGAASMANAFDPYRDALVVEHHTVWPDNYEDWSRGDKARVEALLHASPGEAAELDYVRQHTGFARVITVTPADLERVSVA